MSIRLNEQNVLAGNMGFCLFHYFVLSKVKPLLPGSQFHNIVLSLLGVHERVTHIYRLDMKFEFKLNLLRHILRDHEKVRKWNKYVLSVQCRHRLGQDADPRPIFLGFIGSRRSFQARIPPFTLLFQVFR